MTRKAIKYVEMNVYENREGDWVGYFGGKCELPIVGTMQVVESKRGFLGPLFSGGGQIGAESIEQLAGYVAQHNNYKG